MDIQFIAEVSSNHNRDLTRCLKFVDESARIGCSAVKFQLFKIRELFAPEILENLEHIRAREKWELPVEFLPHLAKRAHDLSIQFSCTPFYIDAVKELEPYVDFYKIASYELLWNDLLKACARTGKPIVMSTGMATMSEIGNAIQILRDSNCKDITVLHCISSYPAPIVQSNLSAINTIKKTFNCKVGWSDHSVSEAVISRAIHKYSASIIEFHIDLDGKGDEFAPGHCWLPEQMKHVIENIKFGISADGNGEKIPMSSELPDREWRTDPSDGLRPFKNIRQKFISIKKN